MPATLSYTVALANAILTAAGSRRVSAGHATFVGTSARPGQPQTGRSHCPSTAKETVDARLGTHEDAASTSANTPALARGNRYAPYVAPVAGSTKHAVARRQRTRDDRSLNTACAIFRTLVHLPRSPHLPALCPDGLSATGYQ